MDSGPALAQTSLAVRGGIGVQGQITALYAGLSALLLIALSVNVIRFRFSEGVGIGDGDKPMLRRAIRVHGNFAEFVPLALLLIYLVEVTGHSAWQVHALGAALVAGRAAHAIGLTGSDGGSPGRAIGMALTFAVLAVAAVMLIIAFLAR